MAGLISPQRKIAVVAVDMQSPNPNLLLVGRRDSRSLKEWAITKAVHSPFASEKIIEFASSFGKRLEVKAGNKDYVIERIESPERDSDIVHISLVSEWSMRVYANTARLLREADGMGLPIALIEYQPFYPLVREPRTNQLIVDAAGERAEKIIKKGCSATSSKGFLNFLGKHGIDSVVLAAFNKTDCGYGSALGMVDELKLRVITSAGLLLGFCMDNPPGGPGPAFNLKVSRFFREKTEFHLKLDGVLSAMKEEFALL